MKSQSLGVALVILAAGVSVPARASEPSNNDANSVGDTSHAASTGDKWTDSSATGVDRTPKQTAAHDAPATAAQPKPVVPVPAAPPPSPAAPVPAPAATPAANIAGQWVYTQQYGWVWMPYDRAYTYVGPEGSPYSYIYYPDAGWCWLYSPWVYGWGPAPYWGIYGPVRFAWYAHPWFARPFARRGYGRGGYSGGFRSGPGFRGGRGHR